MTLAPRRISRRLAGWLRHALAFLTPLGWGVLWVSAVCVAVGVALNWQEFTHLGALGLLLVGVATAWVFVPGEPTATLMVAPSRITEGRAAGCELTVQNGYRPLLHPVLDVMIDEERGASVRLPVLGPLARHREELTLPSRPRGVWAIGPITYDRSDVLGLVRRRIEMSPVSELWVRPRVVRLELLTSGASTDLEGVTSEQLTMSDLAFHALREYRPGDDLRHVHWRSSAKADRLLVRQYRETRRGHVTVLVDHESDPYPRSVDFELAVSVAASIALRAVSDGLDVYLACGSVAGLHQGAEQVLDSACRFRQDPGEYGASALAAGRANPGTGLVIQVSGWRRTTGALRTFAQHLNREAHHVVVRADRAGPAGIADFPGGREIRIGRLSQLPSLMVASLR